MPIVLNNPYLIFGVTYNGQDYEGNGQSIDTGVCLEYERIQRGINIQLKLVMAAHIRKITSSMLVSACM